MLAVVLCFTGLKRLGSVGTTAHAYLREPIGVGMVFHGELPQPSAWMGLAFIVVAVIAMTLPAGRHLRPA